jgi:hypothetical protein
VKHIRSRLSYTNLMATVAIFIALGGSAYAALRITGRDVVNGSLTGRDIRTNSVTGRDVTRLRTQDIENGSLLREDFASGQLPRGPAGPRGPRGTHTVARVRADGTLDKDRTFGYVASKRLWIGEYCLSVATGDSDFFDDPRGGVATAEDGDRAIALTLDRAKVPAACGQYFHVYVRLTRASVGTPVDGSFYALFI